MFARSKRVIALSGGVLMVAGITLGGAGAATAGSAGGGRDDDGKDRGKCTVTLDQRRDTLVVDIDGPRRAESAWGKAEFRPGRDVEGKVELDRRGDARVKLDIPDRARYVTVSIHIRDGRDRIKCDDSLRLRHRGDRD